VINIKRDYDMPRKRNKEQIRGQYFVWLLGARNNGVFYADGRSNRQDAGRHSLGTRDKEIALQQLAQLDLVRAVQLGLAPSTVLDDSSEKLVTLEQGQELYLRHIRRPSVMGGVKPASVKRYRAVLNKFVQFCHGEGIHHWNGVTKLVVGAYGAWLDDDQGYAYATEYLEITTIKQSVKWMVGEKHLPSSCLIALPLKKPQDTTTYCYKTEEIEAILTRCYEREDLIWLGDVILALSHTGLRIGELAQLKWTDFDLTSNMLRLIDASRQGSKEQRSKARTTKSQRDRSLPLHERFRDRLKHLSHHQDGRVFHGPMGGQLKPDTVRNVLIREVLEPLAERFPAQAGEKGFRDGRLHSARHYFCSWCANEGVSEQTLMTWLGHRDSKMVRRYFHLHDQESQRQMMKLRSSSAATDLKPEK
jgi:integrase